jgi:hypothetical protein
VAMEGDAFPFSIWEMNGVEHPTFSASSRIFNPLAIRIVLIFAVTGSTIHSILNEARLFEITCHLAGC